jgi:hypothetical protein
MVCAHFQIWYKARNQKNCIEMVLTIVDIVGVGCT